MPYKDKQQRLDYDKKRYAKSREEFLAHRRAYYKANKEKVKARTHKHYAEYREKYAAYRLEWFRNNKEQAHLTAKRYRERNRERVKANHARFRVRLKAEVFAKYGNKCACCGESEMDFLSMDHVAGDGAKHRKVVKGGMNFYGWLKRQGYPAGYRILCFNCNLARGFYGKCPHESKVRTFMRAALVAV